jgi:hypothetical protein
MDAMNRHTTRRAGKIGARVGAFALAIVLGALLVASALAVGSTPAASVYHKSGTTIQGSLGTLKPPTTPAATTPAATTTTPAATLGSTAASAAKPGAQLPFTGLDLGLVVGAGFLLIVLGFSLRRLTRKPSAT